MKTEGQVLLLKLAHKLSEVRLARKCGIGQPTVSLWISGKRKPNFENRMLLHELFQIPPLAWDRPAEEDR